MHTLYRRPEVRSGKLAPAHFETSYAAGAQEGKRTTARQQVLIEDWSNDWCHVHKLLYCSHHVQYFNSKLL